MLDPWPVMAVCCFVTLTGIWRCRDHVLMMVLVFWTNPSQAKIILQEKFCSNFVQSSVSPFCIRMRTDSYIFQFPKTKLLCGGMGTGMETVSSEDIGRPKQRSKLQRRMRKTLRKLRQSIEPKQREAVVLCFVTRWLCAGVSCRDVGGSFCLFFVSWNPLAKCQKELCSLTVVLRCHSSLLLLQGEEKRHSAAAALATALT